MMPPVTEDVLVDMSISLEALQLDIEGNWSVNDFSTIFDSLKKVTGFLVYTGLMNNPQMPSFLGDVIKYISKKDTLSKYLDNIKFRYHITELFERYNSVEFLVNRNEIENNITDILEFTSL